MLYYKLAYIVFLSQNWNISFFKSWNSLLKCLHLPIIFTLSIVILQPISINYTLWSTRGPIFA